MATRRPVSGQGSAGEPHSEVRGAESERALRALLELLPALELCRSGPQRVEPLGGACLLLTGWECAAFAAGGVDFAERIDPEDRTRVARALEEARDAGRAYRVEYAFEARDGARRRLCECGLGAGDDAWRALALDVTRERALERRRQAALQLEATGRLAGGLAHDFNNQLTAILGYAELLTEALPAGGPSRAQALQIVDSGRRAADLTRCLSLFARREPAQVRAVDLAELLAAADPLLRRLLGADVELVTLPGHDAGRVEADPALIEQALVHLALHARQAMPEGGKLTLEARGAQIVVVERRAGEAPRRPEVEDETGLELARELAERGGGRLEIAAEPGRGTTVALTLPPAAGARPSARLRERAQPPRGSETVLLVEDEPQVRRVASECLAALGYEVLEARSGVEALELLAGRAAAVQLLITDLVLPAMSGRELARRVREARPATRVLFVSGYGGRGAAGDADGASFLSKPFTPASLAAAVRAALDA